jgi:hypothetical protein
MNEPNTTVETVATPVAKKRGRKRIYTTKNVTFVMRDGNWVKRGKGKPKVGEQTKVETISLV